MKLPSLSWSSQTSFWDQSTQSLWPWQHIHLCLERNCVCDCIHFDSLIPTVMQYQWNPIKMETSSVTPIHKKGSKSDPKYYWPMSLTSLISRIMKHIFSSQIISHPESHNIITSIQFSFQLNYSCESQLLLTSEFFSIHLDSNLEVGIRRYTWFLQDFWQNTTQKIGRQIKLPWYYKQWSFIWLHYSKSP